MFRVIFVFVLTLGTVLAPSLAHATAAKWTVEYAKEHCVLSRDGTGGAPGIAFRTRPLAERHDVLFYTPPTRQKNVFGDGVLSIDGRALGGPRHIQVSEPSNPTQRYYHAYVSPVELERFSQAATVGLTAPESAVIEVAVPKMAKAIVALRACEDDLARSWGLEPTLVRGWTTPPKPKRNLKREALRGGWPDWRTERTSNRASFKVGADGVASDCRILVGSGSPKFDDALCKAVLRTAFEPARDSVGRPVASGQLIGAYWTFVWD